MGAEVNVSPGAAMRTAVIAGCLAGALIAPGGDCRPVSAQEKAEKSVKERVAELLAIVGRPDARDKGLEAAVKARDELVKIGEPATPYLVDAALGKNIEIAFWGRELLLRIGKPSLPAIRARWADLNDLQRWELMPVREKFEPDAVREYALNCLDVPWLRATAWYYMKRAKEPRARNRYFRILRGEEEPGLGFTLLPGKEPVYDLEEENKVLIGLLKPDSWATKPAGQRMWDGRPPSWWPDGRPEIIEILRERKVTKAGPALVTILQERGPGGGYLAEVIVHTLVALRYTDAIPELEKIAGRPGKPEQQDRYSDLTVQERRDLATKAIAELRRPRP